MASVSVKTKNGRAAVFEVSEWLAQEVMRRAAEEVAKGKVKRAPIGSKPVSRTKRMNEAASGEFDQAVIDILSEGGEMPLKEIMAELGNRGVALPGQGTAANVNVRLNRMPGVKRPKYGHYKLDRRVAKA